MLSGLKFTFTVESFFFVGANVREFKNFAGSWGHNFVGNFVLHPNARHAR